MNIGRFQPSAALAPFIREYLVIESGTNVLNRTIPDTALVLSFRYGGRIFQGPAGEAELLPGTVLSGLRKQSREFRYERGAANLLAICREGALHAFSRMPAHEVFGRSIDTENLFPAAALRNLMDQLAAAPGTQRRIDILEGFLLRQMTAQPQDALVMEAARIIAGQNGQLRIKALADNLHISQDPLEKRFRAHIGASPKQYATIVRLRQLIRRYNSASSLTQAAYDAGYFDQSHFIRDFRQFTGQLPGDYFRTPQGW